MIYLIKCESILRVPIRVPINVRFATSECNMTRVLSLEKLRYFRVYAIYDLHTCTDPEPPMAVSIYWKLPLIRNHARIKHTPTIYAYHCLPIVQSSQYFPIAFASCRYSPDVIPTGRWDHQFQRLCLFCLVGPALQPLSYSAQ